MDKFLINFLPLLYRVVCMRSESCHDPVTKPDAEIQQQPI